MKEAEKRALRLFKKMTRKSAALKLIPDDKAYGLYIRNACKEKVSIGFVNWLINQDWLTAYNNTYTLSETGRKWLLRQNSKQSSFQEQHRLLRIAEVKEINNPIQINDLESPLAWLRRRKDKRGQPMIEEIQFEAGERLRRDFTHARMSASITANWSLTSPALKKRKHGASGNHNRIPGDNAIDAKKRFYEAVDAIGPEVSSLVVDICCYLKGMEDTEKALGLPKRSGKIVLQIGLSSLARHYGLEGKTSAANHYNIENTNGFSSPEL